MNNFTTERQLLAQYFEQVLPRDYDEQWMVNTCGETLYGWDEQTIASGYLHPAHEFFHQYDQRRFPLLTLCLLKQRNSDPEICKNSLVALECTTIDQNILAIINNGKELAESKVDAGKYPVSVLLTVGYNLRHLAPLLVKEDKKIIPTRRRYLINQFYDALIKGGIQGSVNYYLQGNSLPFKQLKQLIHQHYAISPFVLSFKLAAEIYLAATDQQGSDLFFKAIEHLAILEAINDDLRLKKLLTEGGGVPIAYKDKIPNWPVLSSEDKTKHSWQAWKGTPEGIAMTILLKETKANFISSLEALESTEEQRALQIYHTEMHEAVA